MAPTTRRLISGKVVEPRECLVCHDPFTPRWETQVTCGGRCSRVYGAAGGRRPKKGEIPMPFVKVLERRRTKRRLEIEAICRARWPELSVREIEIFHFARKLGYDQGYQKGLIRQKRQREVGAVAVSQSTEVRVAE